MNCPICHSDHIVKNGFSPLNHKQKYSCQTCKKQFVLDPGKSPISDIHKQLIDRLLLERISLRGICRAVGVSERWLQYYVNDKYLNVPRQIDFSGKSQGILILECDELWSFVNSKQEKQWVWLALGRDTREIVGVHIGDRSRHGAQALWDSIPEDYQKNAISFTDFWEAYKLVFPKARHLSVGKETGQTSHIERFNNTLRQRVSRLVRKSLSFSKKLVNHIGAIWYFIHHYNACLQL